MIACALGVSREHRPREEGNLLGLLYGASETADAAPIRPPRGGSERLITPFHYPLSLRQGQITQRHR
jgi:hypothetical protein